MWNKINNAHQFHRQKKVVNRSQLQYNIKKKKTIIIAIFTIILKFCFDVKF